MEDGNIEIANVLRTADNTSLAGVLGTAKYEDILGFKFYRRRTLKKGQDKKTKRGFVSSLLRELKRLIIRILIYLKNL